MTILHRFACLLVVCALSACQTLGLTEDEVRIDPNALQSLQPATLVEKAANQTPPGVEQVISSYTQLLPLLQDPEAKMRVLHRLADLKLAKGESLMAEQAIDELDIAVGAYQGLLEMYPDRPENDKVLYQLSKTYDLKGNTDAHLSTLTRLANEFPTSQYIIEVQFRRGEILFTQGDYGAAQRAFESVISQGDSVFLANAHYMRGWSLFKQADYRGALLSYTRVLDRVLPSGDTIVPPPPETGANGFDESDSSGSLDVARRYQTLVEDLFRVMGLSFTYLGGADSLEWLFNETGTKPYEEQVYDRYGQLLLDKEQYTDAIEVYERFIALHPLSLWAPRYQMRVIDTLGLAGFISDINAQKVRFIDEYGIYSPFWAEYKPSELQYVQAQLEILLPEQGNRHYVRAQRATASEKNERTRSYEDAARYYGEFVATFPEHPDTPGYLFLIGESYTQLERWRQAIAAFDRAGYEFPAYEKASEAAYASVLAYIELAKNWPQEPEALYEENLLEQQNNRLRFVKVHIKDPRAPDVLYVSTQFEFNRNRHLKAVEYAQQLIDWEPVLENDLVLEAKVMKAHSLYALNDFMLAEQAYHDVLLVLPIEDTRRQGLIENLAATVYKQGEQRLQAGDKLGAVEEFLRVGRVAPSASLRSNAEYDAAGYLVELKEWNRAIDVMSAFRLRYPQHPQINTLVPKMALAYRETEQWENAAGELKTLFELAETEEEKRDTLMIAAELYDRAGNKQQAILSYRQYANTYGEPLDVYMETANRLAELYDETDQPLKRRFWLARQMKTVDENPSRADDRMRYLAAAASAVLAEDAFIRYKRIKLKLPLNESMTAKTEALEKAMKAYQKTASYGISAFSTEAGFRMADIYAQLSRDLMDSDRPDGLSPLEEEQYEILLEEQAFPFEDNAIDIHEQNASRSWNGIYDDWVIKSFDALKKLLPGRYDKPESLTGAINAID